MIKKLVYFICPVIVVMLFAFSCSAAKTPVEGLNTVVEKGYGKNVIVGNSQAQYLLYQTIGDVINVFLSALGVLMLGIIVYSGYLWMMAGGNEERITQAKRWILNATIGIIIIAISFYAVDYILYRLAQL
jgi:integral membrane sensor domain MASE1